MTTLTRSLALVALLFALGAPTTTAAHHAASETLAPEARGGYPVPTAAAIWHDTGTFPNLDHRSYGRARPDTAPYAPAPNAHAAEGVPMKRALANTPLSG